MADIEKRGCPKCAGVMRRGFVVEANSPITPWTLGEGVYWTPKEEGMIGERVALMAYACPECGYVEHYIRYLERDRKIVLKGLP